MPGPITQVVPMFDKVKHPKIMFAILFVAALAAAIGVWTWSAALAFHPGGEHLVAVGPTNPNTKFPEWYEDSTGLQLKLCIGDPVLCIADPVVTGNDVSELSGFGGEGFFWDATAIIDAVGVPDPLTLRRGKGLLVLAIEATYSTGDPAEGAQMTFGRTRIRVDGLTPLTTYKITHPYGVLETQSDADGVINSPIDIGCGPVPGILICDFSLAMAANIGPFLVWDPAVAPAAPDGAIGNPGVVHTVVGSPFDTNFFRVEGPNAGGLGVNIVETNLFAVQGKLFDNAPVALDDTANVPEGAGVRPINVLANDSDRDGNTIFVTAVSPASDGTAAIGTGGGNVVFTPAGAGASVFTYTASSTMPGNPTKTDVATVTVNVHADNAIPVAISDTAQVLPNSLINHILVMANDSDADNDILNLSAVIQPANGVASIEPVPSHIIYRPNASFTGIDVFTYTLSDGLAVATGTVTVTVDTVPAPITDTVAIYMNSGNNTIMVLDNDNDVDGHVLIVTAVTTPNFGTAEVGPFGNSVIFTPAPNFQGTATFTYTVSDNILTATAPVVITVGPQLSFFPVVFHQ